MDRPRVLVVQHEDEVPPGLLTGWLADAGCAVVVVRPDRGEPLPGVAEGDALVVLGGTKGAYDDEAWPWLPQVRRRIAEAARTGLPTLGICLGHQLAAVALGGEVARNPDGPHHGLAPMGWREAVTADPLLGPVPALARAAAWNGDVVTVLPPGATVLAADTDDGTVQAARFTDRVWGVQVHPEADAAIVRTWAESEREQLAAAGLTVAEMVAEMEQEREALEEAWRPLFTRFAGLAKARAEERPPA